MNTTSTINQSPAKRTNLTVHELDNEALVFDATTGDTHRLNDTALFIWRHCDGRRTPDDITKCLIETYDVTPAQAIEHVERLLSKLQDRGLIVSPKG